MKKSVKTTLLIMTILTIVSCIASVIMLKTVMGDELFYMNSTLGKIYAVSYRWVCFLSVILILFWVGLIVRKRNTIKESLPNFKRKAKKQESLPVEEGIVCKKCGKRLTSDNKFCTSCGEPIIGITLEELK